jgi:hypothetical protein
VLALQVEFLITPGVLPLLRQECKELAQRATQIPRWVSPPGLTPQLRQVFTLRVLYGMSAPLTAQEIHLSPGTVEKYMQHVYQRLLTPWGDESSLMGLDLGAFPPKVQAFHFFTLPPKERG